MREHDTAALTAAELEAARREPGTGPAWLPGPHADPDPDGRHRRRTGRAGSRPARLTGLPARPAPVRQACGLRRDAPAPRCRGVLVPGVGGLPGIPRDVRRRARSDGLCLWPSSGSWLHLDHLVGAQQAQHPATIGCG